MSLNTSYFNLTAFATILLFLFVNYNNAYSQLSANYSIQGKVLITGSNEPQPNITVIAKNGKLEYKVKSDAAGHFIFKKLPADIYQLSTSSVNLQTKAVIIDLKHNQVVNLYAIPSLKMLNEVYITASESKGLTSASVIDKKAMQLLQPSSFTDLMELLPGGRSYDPNLMSVNQIRLRETGDGLNKALGYYDTGSLGTAFYIDGAPINTTANIQSTSGFSLNDPNADRNSTNKGVDMRSISTDQIEKVEIVRGIPSAEYGDLTSGLVRIERRKGASPLSARIKSDGFSKLGAIGKGFSFPEHSLQLNVDLGLLDAKADPRSSFENYKRLNTSVRTEKFWQNERTKLTWASAFDYVTTIDNKKTDPDNTYSLKESYKSQFNSYSLTNNFGFIFKRARFLKSLDVASKLSYQHDKIDQTQTVQSGTASILTNSLTEGEHDVSYLTPSYNANLIVDGKPLNAFLKAVGTFGFKSGVVRHSMKTGLEGDYSKNFGMGQQYDLNYPPSASLSLRPRSFKSIPAMTMASAFAEDQASFDAGGNVFTIAAGVRGMTMVGMDNRYALSNKVYLDPRINGKWTLPQLIVQNKPLTIEIGGGYGLHTKLPTLDQLYPAPKYVDLVQLNYFHNNPAFRKANVRTYILDETNFGLSGAINKKWELSADLSFDGSRLSITYFKEKMTSGFRNVSRYAALNYKKYDNASVDPLKLTAAPSLSDFTYQDRREYYNYTITSNGSATLKEGIEYQLTTRRISTINTRITVNGAYFKSTYISSLPLYQVISSLVITDDKSRQYVGIYNDNDGYLKKQFNTNVILDSYLPQLGLMLSTSFQNSWYSSSQANYKTGTPVQYVDVKGNVHPYTDANKKDADLQFLNLTYAESTFRKYSVPIDLQVNLKASKTFKDKARISMFVNRILTYTPDYESNGVQISRSGYNSPYFGMELNFNL